MREVLSILALVMVCIYSHGQNVQVGGTVVDIETGETLIHAHVYNLHTGTGVISNDYGFFSLPVVKNDSIALEVSYVGYEKKIVRKKAESDLRITIALKTNNELHSIVVRSRLDNSNSQNRLDRIMLTGNQLEKIPGLLGERDLVKSLQLLPGIQMGKEGSSGLYVRGGDASQNLILLDGVPVYNINHLFGFFSVFTPEAVKSVDVYKGGFPARYEGRLSSVIDVRLKEGNLYKKNLDISVGTISSKVVFESPIKKGRSSFLVAARRTYADLFYTPLTSFKQERVGGGSLRTNLGYGFYDLNVKSNFILNENNRLYLSLYTGRDRLHINEREKSSSQMFDTSELAGNMEKKTTMENLWGNITATARWNKIFGPKLFANTTLIFSRYQYQTTFKNHSIEELLSDTLNESINYLNASSIRDLGLKIDFDYAMSAAWNTKFGGKVVTHHFVPGNLIMQYRSVSDPDDNFQYETEKSDDHVVELDGYFENHINPTEWLHLNAGMNVLLFSRKNNPYYSFQPRFSCDFRINTKSSVKASVSWMAQPIHLLINNGTSFPVDIWVPALREIEPASALTFDIGAHYRLSPSVLLSMALYYKKMEGVINYKNGESFFTLDNDWTSKVITGDGESYGAEWLLRKNEGKTTGWVGYTLSWANRRFPELNNGHTFPFRYDSRNRINVVAVHKLNKHIELSLTWTYSTGVPVTISSTLYKGQEIYERSPVSGALEEFGFSSNQVYSPQSITYYSGINQARLPDYHRLDLGINLIKQKKRGERIWNFSIYNAYGRNNPFVIYTKKEEGKLKFKNFSIFRFMPSVSYRFKFKSF
ncbi:TonB-dependent receptor [Sunxiuqinia indica]|uniref:TonB-dependent receptor n=1 Tax=Sunxiuqinia indica TaxID=2692584 RepID=UPI00135A9656|nr:TonB-dependent receptor plug domain-containing protein [Sunxiuqinia indica]